MKIIVTHASPDLDGITSIWLIKKFLPGWENAKLQFVPAGERLHGVEVANRKIFVVGERARVLSSHKQVPASQTSENFVSSPRQNIPTDPIEQIGKDEVIHVDTGMVPLDHHQTDNMNVAAASLTFDFIKVSNPQFGVESEKVKDREEAIGRIVRLVVDIDHFQEVFWDNPTADFHEFSLIGILEGLKLQKPDQDEYYIDFISDCLDTLLHDFENRIWAEKEIREKGREFKTKWGKGLAIESINDTVIKLAQKMGYAIVIRKDPRKGYVRVKAKPLQNVSLVSKVSRVPRGEKARDTRGTRMTRGTSEEVDLTLMYEKLRKMDPEATWYLHVSKKMLLNGTIKNPNMKPTKLSLDDIIKVLRKT